ncbi:MAG: hypothetical protein JWO36_5165 [Myxococcales bacterium]|nr:hypothetical protein [Myxococcales bacterium]
MAVVVALTVFASFPAFVLTFALPLHVRRMRLFRIEIILGVRHSALTWCIEGADTSEGQDVS